MNEITQPVLMYDNNLYETRQAAPPGKIEKDSYKYVALKIFLKLQLQK